MLPLCCEEGIAVVPWSPLARGFLAGNRRPTDRGDTLRAKTDDLSHRYYYADADFGIAARVTELARRRGATPAQVALAWLLSKPGVTAPIVGASRLPHRRGGGRPVDRARRRRGEVFEECRQPHPVLDTLARLSAVTIGLSRQFPPIADSRQPRAEILNLAVTSFLRRAQHRNSARSGSGQAGVVQRLMMQNAALPSSPVGRRAEGAALGLVGLVRVPPIVFRWSAASGRRVGRRKLMLFTQTAASVSPLPRSSPRHPTVASIYALAAPRLGGRRVRSAGAQALVPMLVPRSTRQRITLNTSRPSDRVGRRPAIGGC